MSAADSPKSIILDHSLLSFTEYNIINSAAARAALRAPSSRFPRVFPGWLGLLRSLSKRGSSLLGRAAWHKRSLLELSKHLEDLQRSWRCYKLTICMSWKKLCTRFPLIPPSPGLKFTESLRIASEAATFLAFACFFFFFLFRLKGMLKEIKPRWRTK